MGFDSRSEMPVLHFAGPAPSRVMSARINEPYSVGRRCTSGRMAVVCSLAVDAVGFSRGILNPALFRFRSPLPKLRTQPTTVVCPSTIRRNGSLVNSMKLWSRLTMCKPPESLKRAFREPSETFSPNFIPVAYTALGIGPRSLSFQ